MKTKYQLMMMMLFQISLLYSQIISKENISRDQINISFSLISTNTHRGGGGFSVEYFSPQWNRSGLGIRSHFGFFGYENSAGTIVESNSIAVLPMVRFFPVDDVYLEGAIGIIHDENEVYALHGSTLAFFQLIHSAGFGYAIHYSPKISAMISTQSLSVRGRGFTPLVEHQFLINVGVSIRIL
ncbi:MAG: hypothetical protein PHP42_10440 [Bacteroidota bacterium]|nr:hypothetical protein [Bacteroidota bacterium]